MKFGMMMHIGLLKPMGQKKIKIQKCKMAIGRPVARDVACGG